jgi:transposase
MGTFVGLDVSLKETSVCILDQDGTRVFEGKVASEPSAIARLIRKRAPDLARVGLESGPTSVWLTHALRAEGLPVVCLDARHAQAVLSVRPNKTDRGDARGLADMVRVGWFKAVQVKSLASHERKTLLIVRHQLVDMRVRMDNQLRGILKSRSRDWPMQSRADRATSSKAVGGTPRRRQYRRFHDGGAGQPS